MYGLALAFVIFLRVMFSVQSLQFYAHQSQSGAGGLVVFPRVRSIPPEAVFPLEEYSISNPDILAFGWQMEYLVNEPGFPRANMGKLMLMRLVTLRNGKTELT